MGKRAANKEAKSPKKAKVAPSPEAPVLAAIDALSIPVPACQMLKAALPYCLADKEKHAFQTDVLESISKLFQGVEQEKASSVSELETKLSKTQTQRDSAAAEIDTKKQAIDSKKKECDEKSKTVDEATEAMEEARKKLSEAKKSAEEFDSKKIKLKTDQDNLEKLTKESWLPLRDSAFGSSEWRKRNKAITELRQAFATQVNMEPSLLDALEVTLKVKAETRDDFAKLSIEYAEDACKRRAEKIAEDIAGLDEEGAGHKNAIEVAMATLSEREKAKELAESDFSTEQDKWVDLQNITLGLSQALKEHDAGLEDASEELELARESLKEFQDVSALFVKLKDPPEEQEPVVEASVAPETVEASVAPETVAVPVAMETVEETSVAVEDPAAVEAP